METPSEAGLANKALDGEGQDKGQSAAQPAEQPSPGAAETSATTEDDGSALDELKGDVKELVTDVKDAAAEVVEDVQEIVHDAAEAVSELKESFDPSDEDAAADAALRKQYDDTHSLAAAGGDNPDGHAANA